MNVVFNRDLKTNYSWLPKGIAGKIINKNVSGRCTLIASIFSDGNFLRMIVDDTVKTFEFWTFLLILKYTLHQSKILKEFNIWVTLDNAPVHTSHRSKEILKWLDIEIHFLSPHSPDLAPVELFFRWIKKKIWSMHYNKSLNFNKIEGRKSIYSILENWEAQQIQNLLIEFISNAKRIILRFYSSDRE